VRVGFAHVAVRSRWGTDDEQLQVPQLLWPYILDRQDFDDHVIAKTTTDCLGNLLGIAEHRVINN